MVNSCPRNGLNHVHIMEWPCDHKTFSFPQSSWELTLAYNTTECWLTVTKRDLIQQNFDKRKASVLENVKYPLIIITPMPTLLGSYLDVRSVWKLFVFDENTWYHVTKLFVFDGNTWYYVTKLFVLRIIIWSYYCLLRIVIISYFKP